MPMLNEPSATNTTTSATMCTLQVHCAIDQFQLTVDQQLALSGVVAVFGPSGSGKSTLLRSIAGFVTPAHGCITLGEDAWLGYQPRDQCAGTQTSRGYDVSGCPSV